MSRNTFYLLLIGLGIIGIIIVNYSTYWGVGLIDWDSFNYISSARNLANGKGYVIPLYNEKVAPMTHFPPMLPSLLAIFEVIGLDAIYAARIINIVLFGFSAVLAGITLKEITKSFYFGLLGSILFVSSDIFIELHSWALSEPLLLFFTLLGFLIFYKYYELRKFILLIITGIILGLAFLTKYAGAANVGAVLLTILILKNKEFKQKLKEVAVVVFISMFPMVLWTVRNYTLTETFNARGIGYHPMGIGNFVQAFQTFFSWYFPEFLLLESKKLALAFLVAIVLIAIIVLTVYYGKNYKAELLGRVRKMHFNALTFTYASYTLVYILVIMIAKTFFDPKIGMSDRMFSPVLLSSLVLVVTGLSDAWSRKSRWMQAMVISVSTYLIVLSIVGSLYRVPDFHENGLGLNRKEIQNSVALRLLDELADEKPIYNNYSFALYLRTGQAGFKLNRLRNQNITTNSVILVIYKSKSPEPHAIVERLSENLELLEDDEIASVYLYKVTE